MNDFAASGRAEVTVTGTTVRIETNSISANGETVPGRIRHGEIEI